MSQGFTRGIFLMVLMTLLVAFVGQYRVNFTASLPRGLYQLQSQSVIHRGDLVMVCLPRSVALMGHARGYLMAGRCHKSQTIPVVKQVIALPGDWIMQTPRWISVNHQRYGAPVQRVDGVGRALPHPPFFQIYQTTRYWLYGSHQVTTSWDSRYYGGVKRQSIESVVRPIWVEQPVETFVELPVDLNSTGNSTTEPKLKISNKSNSPLKKRVKTPSPFVLAPYFFQVKNFLTTRSHPPIPWSGTRGEDEGRGSFKERANL